MRQPSVIRILPELAASAVTATITQSPALCCLTLSFLSSLIHMLPHTLP